MKASDIPEKVFHEMLITAPHGYLSLYEIQDRLPDYPPKVVHARLRALVKSKKLSAQCTCGCKGPYCEKRSPGIRWDALDWYLRNSKDRSSLKPYV